MKKTGLAALVLAAVLFLAGCGFKFDPAITCLYVQKDGTVTQAIVESFEKDFFDVDELKSMTEREIGAYNSRYGEEKIKVSRLEVEDETLYHVMDFADADVYSDYSEEFCYVGTVGEALDEGFPFSMDFKDRMYNMFTTAEVTEDKDADVVILKEEGVVELEEPVKYVSNNVDVIDEHMVQVMPITDEKEYAYIIY